MDGWLQKSTPRCIKNQPTLASDKTALIIHGNTSKGYTLPPKRGRQKCLFLRYSWKNTGNNPNIY